MRRSAQHLLPGMKVRLDYDGRLYVVCDEHSGCDGYRESFKCLVRLEDHYHRLTPFREEVEVIEEKSS